MKHSNQRIYWFCLIVIIFLGFITGAFFSAGYWLQSGDEPEKADAIIVLSGEPTRAFYAADLYNKGYAPYVYISKVVRGENSRILESIGIFVPSEEEIYREVLVRKGVPTEKIRIFKESVISTVEEAETVNRLFNKQNCRILVVTSPFHVRRTKMIYRNTVKHCESRILRTPYENFPKKWWTRQDSATNVILEITKILFYQLGGRFRSYQ